MRFETIKLFSRVAELGSFTRAAAEMDITPQGASQLIRDLERTLGVRLLNRSTRKLSLTEDGKVFLEHCRDGIRSIDQAMEVVRHSNDQVSGQLRIAVTPMGLAPLVMPIMARFLQANALATADVVVDNHLPDVVGRSIDMGVISGGLPSSSLVARKVASFRTVLCASPSYLKRHGTPRALADLKDHLFVRMFNPQMQGRSVSYAWRDGASRVALDLKYSLQTDDGDVALAATLAGAGIAQIASWRIRRDVAEGRLKLLNLPFVPNTYGVYVYTPRRTELPLRTRALTDFLLTELRALPEFRTASPAAPRVGAGTAA
ncbi:MAG TPA: LysR substrate-binding domain-containing protein [Nevskiaceae bacterium]|nr:LysR substrate-binding domain-containing protein [Nevskiaceae bacterium]